MTHTRPIPEAPPELQKPTAVTPPKAVRRRGDVEFITWADGLVTRHGQVDAWVEPKLKNQKRGKSRSK